MKTKYEMTLLFRSVTVRIETTEGEPIFRIAGDINANEVAALHAIAQTMKCLSNGIELGPHFNPTIDVIKERAKQDQVVKCQWEKNGGLTILGPCDRFFMHAPSYTEAMKRVRVFTTTAAIADTLPKKRV